MQDKTKTKFVNIALDLEGMVIIVAIVGIVVTTILSGGLSSQAAFLIGGFLGFLLAWPKDKLIQIIDRYYFQLKTLHYAYR